MESNNGNSIIDIRKQSVTSYDKQRKIQKKAHNRTTSMMMMNSSSIGGISEINYMAEEVAKELPNNHFMKRRKTKQES